MRKTFSSALLSEMREDKNIWVVTGDLGWGVLDGIRKEFPERFINVGASEMAGVDICVGLALSGNIPFFYSITPFVLYRPFESIRYYLNYEGIPVKLIGTGRNKDYGDLGFSHWSEEDRQVMKLFPNIKSYWPKTKEEIPKLLVKVLYNKVPSYINLPR